MFGQELLAFLKQAGHVTTGFNRQTLDLDGSVSSLAESLRGHDAVINAAAFTSVDGAELNVPEANKINGTYAGRLAQASKSAEVRFIHISSDYVFRGLSDEAYGLDHQIDPQSAYGKSKALGEKLVAESCADYSILRTAWLYGANGRCFPKVIAETLKGKGSARVINDQIGQPTWTRDLAEIVIQVLALDEMPKIVHAVSSGQATWAEFAKEVAKSIGLTDDAVKEISTAEYPTSAKRPAWSVLDNSSDVVTPIGDWRERWHKAAPEVLRGI